MSDDNVVFLAFKNNDTAITHHDVLTCKGCKNKTFVAIYEENGEGFPTLKCACCGEDGGTFGFINGENKK